MIGVNADRARGLAAAAIRSATPQEAAAKAAGLLAQGRSIDLGLMQINATNLARHGLTVETVFDACRNMAAGANHYADDVRAVWTLAHRRYNTGSTERGAAYAASVEQVLARVRSNTATLAPTVSPVAPDVPRPAPPSWDVYGQAKAARGQDQPSPLRPDPIELRAVTPQQAALAVR